jgi:hypothetical protein
MMVGGCRDWGTMETEAKIVSKLRRCVSEVWIAVYL